MGDTKICEGRVARLRELMLTKGLDAVVVRNNPDLRWLTGAERTFDYEQAHTAFITADGLWLHTDSRYYNTFLERLGTTTDWMIDQDQIDAPSWAAGRVAASKSRVVAVEDTVSLAFFDAFTSACDAATTACLTPRLHGDISALRMIKDAEELELMRRAQAVTDAAFDHICAYIKVGMTEQQIRVELETYMLTHGADALSFDSIVATGANGANPHAQPGDTRVSAGDFIVIDFGAGIGDYHSDMTRTVCVGEPSAEQRHVYDVVRLAHETCASAAMPDCVGADIHNLAVSIIAEAGYGEYFGHGLGHGVGLEIHELPNFARSYTAPIPVGSVVTIEPGIYLPGRFGVRLEDFGVMTEDGYKPFTHSTHELVCLSV